VTAKWIEGGGDTPWSRPSRWFGRLDGQSEAEDAREDLIAIDTGMLLSRAAGFAQSLLYQLIA
jgi:hypothetical protein